MALEIENPMTAIWAEKYRPTTILNCILPKRFKDFFQTQLDKKQVVHSIFFGIQGVGKTTCAKALCEELKLDYITINATKDGNIDELRDKIQTFASNRSIKSAYKVIILDELGEERSPVFQPALKSFMEQYHTNCRFIITTNHLNKIIEPLQSRCVTLGFNYTKEERKEMAVNYMIRLKEILENEGVEYNKVLASELVKRYFPDFRKTIVELQRNCVNGIISDSILNNMNNDSISTLYSYLKDSSKWFDMKKWVVENIDNDVSIFIDALYKNADKYLKPSSIPELITILSEYDYRIGRVVNKEITLVAMMTDIMSKLEFK